MTAGLRLEPLSERHSLKSFDCKNKELNEWLINYAHHAVRQGTRTYVLVEGTKPEVLGYFAIAPHFVERQDLPARISRGAPITIPAVLLAKFALHLQLQGKGLGGEFLLRALSTILEAGRLVGGKLVVVDAVDEGAALFYAKYDFQPVSTNPRRLVLKLSTIAKALDLDWP